MKNSSKNKITALCLRVLVKGATLLTVGCLAAVVLSITVKGLPHINASIFAWKYNSENVSMTPALINTLSMTALALAFAVPLGIGAAVYMAEYARRGNRFVALVGITSETLAGIPSIVYGLFGMLFFVTACHFGISLISGALTLGIMILPLIMRTAEEALRSVPDSYREGSFGLGAGRLRTVFGVVLPAAMPGIFAGIMLAIGRIAGETAALIYTSGTVAEIATSLGDSARTLSIHMYALSSEGLYMDQSYATAFVLLVIVVAMNALSQKAARRLSNGKV